MRTRVGWVAIVALVAVVGVAIWSRSGSWPLDERSPDRSIPPNGALLAEVDGIGAVYAGTAQDPGTLNVTAARATTRAPATLGALSVGKGMSVNVPSPVKGELEVHLKLPAAPSSSAIPGVIHLRADGSIQIERGLWYPGENEMVVWASSFSDRWGAWYDPRNWAEEVIQTGQGAFDFVADFITGRTDPPACANNPPPWSRSRTRELSSLHTCTQSNRADDGAERFELYLASNRRTAQVVSVPSTEKDYLWIQNQPEGWYRGALAAFARVNPSTNVVLLGEHAMSMGFRRPLVSVDFEVRAYQTWPVIVANPVLALFGNLPVDGLLAVYSATSKCLSEFSGFDVTRADLIPDGAESRTQFLGQMVRCAFEVIQDPALAVGLAGEALAAVGITGAGQATVLNRVRSGFSQIAPTAKRVALALALPSTVTNAWDGVFDNLAAGSVAGHLEGTPGDGALGSCSVARMVADLGPTRGRDLSILDPGCVSGWAIVNLSASCRQACGDTNGLVQIADGRWQYVGGFPGPFCVDEARRRGVPQVFLPRFAPCTAAPTTTTTSRPAPMEGRRCGTVVSKSGTTFAVVLLTGSLSCAEAVTLVNTYFHDPPVPPQGSSGSVTIGPWLCASSSAAGTALSGRAGGCRREDTGDAIEIRAT